MTPLAAPNPIPVNAYSFELFSWTDSGRAPAFKDRIAGADIKVIATRAPATALELLATRRPFPVNPTRLPIPYPIKTRRGWYSSGPG